MNIKKVISNNVGKLIKWLVMLFITTIFGILISYPVENKISKKGFSGFLVYIINFEININIFIFILIVLSVILIFCIWYLKLKNESIKNKKIKEEIENKLNKLVYEKGKYDDEIEEYMRDNIL